MTLLLNGSEVKQAVSMQEAIELVEQGFADFGKGLVDMPQRPVIMVPAHKGFCTFMPAYVRETAALAVKTVTAFKDNPSQGLPTIFGTVILLDTETGYPLCIMDAGYLTALRTGAASGVATKYLAREDARVLAIIGTGTQGRTQLEAMCTVRDLKKVLVFDVDAASAQSFVEEMAGQVPIPDDVRVVRSTQEAISGADIVVTASTSATPVLDGEDLKPGTHINNVGSHALAVRELDTRTVVRSKIVCDSVEACLVEAGDLLIPMQEGAISESDIHGGLAQVISGEIAGREGEEEITLFKSVGLAFQDAVVALRAYQQASDMGLGSEFQF
jgi:ornithine cyclodeaminase/alanine dehydrogenase